MKLPLRNDRYSVFDADDERIGDCISENFTVPEDISRAAFICRAANFHESLVQALKPFVESSTYDNAMKWSTAMKAAREILALVEGQP